MELLIATGLSFAAVLAILVVVLQSIARSRLLFLQRINTYSIQERVENAIQEELSVPLRERMTRPLQRIVKVLPERALSAVTLEGLTRKLMLAGYPGNLSAAEFIALRYSLVVILPLLVFLVSIFSGTSLVNMAMLLLLAGIIGYFIPDIFLKLKRTSRQEEISKQLPDVLDLLCVSVEAGLGFDAAIAKVVEKMEGAFPQELGRLLQEVKMGKARREALRDLKERIDVDGVTNFVSAIIQADHLGVSMGNVLRLQSKDSREKRRQVAQEKAQKAPIKMLLPLVFFVFPALFIVLLGPAMLQLLDGFVNM